jgi:hypothetical protein|tara:strand:+ start:54 stop:731 length:678 start_codon:yes stop_codon:yes gene_type:complete
MASKKIETLVPRVKREAPSCPDFIAIDELRNTLIDFCVNTDIYMADLEALQISAGINEYDVTDLTIPVATEMNHILDIFRSTSDTSVTQTHKKTFNRLEPKSQIGGISIYSYYGEGTAKYYTQKDQDTLLFAPSPNKAEKLYVLYSLKPTITASTIPSIIANEYMETIVHGALYRLQMMKGSPWTDVEGASLNKQLYDKGEAIAVRKSKYGNVGAALTVRYQEFA